MLPTRRAFCARLGGPVCARVSARVLAIGLLAAGPAQAQTGPVTLRTTGQEANTLKFDPGNLQAPGFSVELIQALEKRDPRLKFSGQDVLRPVKRIDLELEAGTLDVFFGLVRTPAREAKLQLLDTLYTQSGQLAVRASDPVAVQSWDEVRTLGPAGVIGVPKGSAYADLLRAETGLSVDDGVASVSATLRKLLSGRVRFVFFSDVLLARYLRDEGLEADIRLLPTRFSTQEVCLAAARQADPAALARLRAALDGLRRSGALRQLQDKYQVRP